MSEEEREDGSGAVRWLALPFPQTFAPSGGWWHPTGADVVADDPSLVREAARMQDELAALGVPRRSGSVVRLRRDPAQHGESFAIEVGDDIVVTSGTAAGGFRATRQLLHNLRAQRSVPRGRVSSAPAVAERGLHLDAARKHYPVEWMLRLLPALADVGINVLQWHFSENEGFRLESEAFPEIVSDEHITRADATRILAAARDLHIEVIPSLDMPGHLRHVLARHPDLRMPPDLVTEDAALDITRAEAVDFAHRLIDDMAPVFAGCTRWHLGGDEFVDFTRIDDYPALADAARERYGDHANGFDLLTAFVNGIAAHVRRLGFEPRVWNDGMLRSSAVALDPRVVLTWWTNWNAQMRPLSDAVAAGHRLVNVNDGLFYYVLGEKAGYRYPTAERIWDADWHPGLFPALPGGVRQEIAPPYPDLLLGASFAIWSDEPAAQTVDEVTAGVRTPLRAMAERAWNGGSQLSLAEFTARDEAIGSVAVD